MSDRAKRLNRLNKEPMAGKVKQLEDETKLSDSDCLSSLWFDDVVFVCELPAWSGHTVHLESGLNWDGSFYRMTWDDGAPSAIRNL